MSNSFLQLSIPKRLPFHILVRHLCLLLGLALLNPSLAAERQDPSVYQHKAPRDLVGMVNDAAELFAAKGEKAFDEFSRPGSRWLQENRFIFVFDENGICVFYPEHPAHVGKNLIDVKDVLDKPFLHWLVAIGTSREQPYGWVHYHSPPPQSLFPLWKSSYAVAVRDPGGKRYVLGSGLYNIPPERRFIVDLVDRAADLIERQGVKAFPALHEEAGNYNLLGIYVYVFTLGGELKVDPAYPS